MSGGHWEYVQHRMRDGLQDIIDDLQTREEFPDLIVSAEKLNVELSNILRSMDWHLSGDTVIEDIKKFERDSIKRLRACFETEIKVSKKRSTKKKA